MIGNPEERRRRLRLMVERFRQKGATSPGAAMTAQELGLPPHFDEAMHRRLGQSGIFVEVNGKYYLNESRLKQIQELRTNTGPKGGRTGPPGWYRYVGILLMLPLAVIIAVVLFYLVDLREGFFPGELLVIILVIALLLFVVRLLFWRTRMRYWREHQEKGIAQSS